MSGDESDRKQAVGQICSTSSMAHNLAQCRTVIQKAVAKGAKVRSAVIDWPCQSTEVTAL